MILLRCDASTEIGTGHFFRLLSLGEYACERGVKAEIAMYRPPEGLVEQADGLGLGVRRLETEPGTNEEAKQLERWARLEGARAVVVDGYHFPPSYYRALSGHRWTVTAIDDIAHQPFPVDVLVNVNIDAEQLDYQTPPRTDRLLGIDYTLMRHQFRRKRKEIEESGGPEIPEQIEQILVFMGGSDPTDETTKVLKGLARANYRGSVDVVIGASNPNEESIRRVGHQLETQVCYHKNVSQMANLIAGHHLSINAGGGTSWEMACLGVPMLQIVVADNQADIVEGLDKRGISTSLGWHEDVTPADIARAFRTSNTHPERRKRQVLQGMEKVDGRGVKRLLEHLLDLGDTDCSQEG